MSIKRCSLALVGFVCLTLMVGCQPKGSAPSSSAMPPVSKAVLVTAGQGYVVYTPAADGTVYALTGDATHTCKQCEADAAGYFKTGHIDPVCSTCGAHRTILQPQNIPGIN